jgi:hypothetical protein
MNHLIKTTYLNSYFPLKNPFSHFHPARVTKQQKRSIVQKGKGQWQKEEVDSHLQEIMIRIHDKCVEYGREEGGFINYVKGANIAGFIRIADAMIDQGIV